MKNRKTFYGNLLKTPRYYSSRTNFCKKSTYSFFSHKNRIFKIFFSLITKVEAENAFTYRTSLIDNAILSVTNLYPSVNSLSNMSNSCRFCRALTLNPFISITPSKPLKVYFWFLETYWCVQRKLATF